jgi:uncharacterized protein YjbI with pentapeptide repeats
MRHALSMSLFVGVVVGFPLACQELLASPSGPSAIGAAPAVSPTRRSAPDPNEGRYPVVEGTCPNGECLRPVPAGCLVCPACGRRTKFNLEQYERLRLGADVCNAWWSSFADEDRPPVHLYRADLRGMQLNGVLLAGTLLAHADLSGASMAGADLRRAKIYGAKATDGLVLRGAHLDGVRARLSHLAGADLHGVHLPRADLREAHLLNCNLDDADLTGATLTGALLTGAHMEHATLDGADLRRIHAREAVLMFAHATAQRANLTGADLRGAILTGVRLPRAYLRGAELQGADLTRAKLAGAQLQGASLEGTALDDAAIASASFVGAKLNRSSTLWNVEYDRGTDFRATRVAGAQGEPQVLAALRTNALRLHAESWYPDHPVLALAFRPLLSAVDYGASADRLPGVFGLVWLVFAWVYMRCPHILEDKALEPGKPWFHSKQAFRSLYFSLTVMTTLGLGDIRPNPKLGGFWFLFAHAAVMFQAACGYLLLALLAIWLTSLMLLMAPV